MTRDDILAPLNFAIQYRRKRDACDWTTMVAVDTDGAGVAYYSMQNTTAEWPWEYRLIEIETGAVIKPESGGGNG